MEELVKALVDYPKSRKRLRCLGQDTRGCAPKSAALSPVIKSPDG